VRVAEGNLEAELEPVPSSISLYVFLHSMAFFDLCVIECSKNQKHVIFAGLPYLI
jgi:hypothetical protein